MKFLAALMVVALLFAIGGVAWLSLDATITVEATGTAVVEASAQTALFDQLRQQMDNNAVIGTTFRKAALDNPADYQFTVYTIRLKNNCFITADMVELQISPTAGDILQVGQDAAHALRARSTGDIQATILSDIGTQTVREITVTYYMWGIPFSLKTTTR